MTETPAEMDEVESPRSLTGAPKPIPIEPLEDFGAQIYWRKLVECSQMSLEAEFPFAFGQFAGLQRQNILFLQNRLARIKTEIAKSGTTSRAQSDDLVETMHRYGSYHSRFADMFFQLIFH